MTLKQALWEIVRDENIIITNQNIDWLLDRASKKASGDAQALKESILERKRVIEENIPPALTNEEKVSVKEKQIEEMCEVLRQNAESCKTCSWYEEGLCIGNCELAEDNQAVCEALYNAGYRKQSEGEWKRVGGDLGYVEMECSVCGYTDVYDDDNEPHKFCPECGAKMKGGVE